MHMLFQSEAAYRQRRSWMPRSGDDVSATTVLSRSKRDVTLTGPRRPRWKSRNCKTSRREITMVKLRTKKSDPEIELDGEDDAGDEEARQNQQEERAIIFTTELQDEVLAMQMEIEMLQQRRLLLDSAMVNARTNAVAKAIDLAKGFYVHFSNGFDPVNQPEQSRQAETFLRGIMRKDVVCAEFQGVDLFLNQYKVCTACHDSMRVLVHDILVINEDVSSRDGAIQVLAKTTARFRVNRATLETVFPSIIQDEELTQQLIGKKYAIQYDKVFHFKQGQVFQHESQVDFCNSILEMTQNPFVAIKLLEASLMTKRGHIKVDSRIEEDMNQLENTVL